jgi:hypothetical protein
VLLAPRSRAQTCFANAGPDVIVGDISGMANYAPSGGVEALSAGVTLCNVGTVWLDFFASTNRHPVIGSGLYRYKVVDGASRFEQVGNSWVFHGFFALSSSLCCTCTPTDGTHLGVGCSDPSTASRQGAQVGLGPRWQVNAFTGAFPYPPANPPFAGSVARRLQVQTSDLEVTGPPGAARYFVEKVVVAPDDASAGNAANNASWREVTATSNAGDWTFGTTGATTRGEAALRVWQDLDPAVEIVDVQVPGEGRFLLGARATDLGGGVWRYEYALANANSDAAGQSFSIPVPGGLAIAGVGFHDVAYHDGDGIGGIDASGVDWTPTLAGGALTFATETFAQNPNANALRWGTLYNFRFDAAAPPADGSATLGLFETPGTVAIPAPVPALSPGTSTCAGDGLDPLVTTPCPCGNSGAAGRGCGNSQSASGAALASAGTTSPDTVVLTATGELPSSLSIFLQGDGNIPAGVAFGDGIRCAGGTLKRLYVRNAAGGAVVAPQMGDLAITARSAALGDPIQPGDTRWYAVYYRDPSPVFCPTPPGSTFNATNGQTIVWN